MTSAGKKKRKRETDLRAAEVLKRELLTRDVKPSQGPLSDVAVEFTVRMVITPFRFNCDGAHCRRQLASTFSVTREKPKGLTDSE